MPIQTIYKQIGVLEKKVLNKKLSKSQKGLEKLHGLWKENPRTKKDLKKIRHRLSN